MAIASVRQNVRPLYYLLGMYLESQRRSAAPAFCSEAGCQLGWALLLSGAIGAVVVTISR